HLADQLFGAAGTVDERGIQEIHPEVEGGPDHVPACLFIQIRIQIMPADSVGSEPNRINVQIAFA
ncbi:hypothetical protein BGX30_005190, partial [Mortierella sp. GBA39]